MENKENSFMFGQRVIYRNAICTVCRPENKLYDPSVVWVDNPEKGYKHWVDPNNLRPLPGGQL